MGFIVFQLRLDLGAGFQVISQILQPAVFLFWETVGDNELYGEFVPCEIVDPVGFSGDSEAAPGF